MDLIKKNKEKIIAFLATFGVQIFQLITADRLHDINGWVGVWYGADYSIGFGSRLFMGTVLHAILGDYISAETAKAVVILFLVIGAALIALVIAEAIGKCRDDISKAAITFLSLIFLAGPGSIGYLWTEENMGRLETYLLSMTLVMFFLGMRIKNDFLMIGIMSLLATMCIAIHQVWALLYFPLVFVMYVDRIWKSNFNKRVIVCSVVSCMYMIVLCVVFELCMNMRFDDLNLMFKYIQSRSGVPMTDATLEQEYFWPFYKHYTLNYLPEARTRARNGFITFVLLLPMFGSYIYVWIRARKHSRSKVEKWKYTIMTLPLATYVLVFGYLTDWGRWFAALVLVDFGIVIYLWLTDDVGIKKGIEDLGRHVKQLPILFGAIVVYLTAFEKFEGCNYVNQSLNFYHFVYNLIH